jgi:alpha-D-xyloside xylohydrolase
MRSCFMRSACVMVAMMPVAFGCRSGGGSAPDTRSDIVVDAPGDTAGDATPETADGPVVGAAVTPVPFAVAFSWEGTPLVEAAAGEQPAVYLLRSEGERVYPVGAPETSQEGETLTYRVRFPDERGALLSLRPAGEGALELRYEMADLQPDERLGVRLAVGADEAFYGLMERVVQGNQDESWAPGLEAGLDLRGQQVELYVRPTVSIYSPFFLSSAGYGVFVDSDWPGAYRFGVAADGSKAPDEITIEYEGGVLPLKIIPGPAPIEVSERYARLTGLPLLPPRWAFGPWRWRDDIYPLDYFYDGTPYAGPYNSMVVEDVLMMEFLGVPCSLYWIDRPWAQGPYGYDDLEWDTERIPDPIGMIDMLNQRGIRFMLWIAPWAIGEQMASQAEASGFDVEGILHHVPGAKLLDLTNGEAVSWWQDWLIRRIDENVLGFKLDRAEETVPDGVQFTGHYDDGTSYREGHNRYPYLYARAVQGAFERAGVDEYLVMPRAGWKGSSKHAVFWGGDTDTSEWGLRSAIIAVQRAAVMNFPVWGSDTCGYKFPSSHEVCTRWMAFSAFTPLMEVGPLGNVAPYSMNEDGQEADINQTGYHYEPVWNETLVAAWIFYANLHQDLTDYSYAQAAKAHEDGTPFVRPMAVAFPGNPAYRKLWDQYLYGPDILVAPVWKTGTTTRDVDIPNGEWIDAWSGQKMTPGATVRVDVPLHKIAIYVRANSAVDLGDLNAKWAAAAARAAARPNLAELVEGAGL